MLSRVLFVSISASAFDFFGLVKLSVFTLIPSNFRQNPAQMHRLIPFLNRELNVLLENGTRTAYVLEKVLELLPLYSMTSSMFRNQVARLIGHQHAPHFCHELRAFASSPFDMASIYILIQLLPLINNSCFTEVLLCD